jgi:uncharacterized protein YqjF (DUF2071 family)
MAGREHEERVDLPLLHQKWKNRTFLHWAYDPADVRRALPPGLEPDTFNGKAWVGLTPFVVAGFRPTGLPPVPGLSTFPETNLRTYVRDRRGRDGLWFLSLEVSRLATVVGARTFYWVPYHWATMRVDERDA